MTWLFVRIRPDDVSTIPVPVAHVSSRRRFVLMTTTPVPIGDALSRVAAIAAPLPIAASATKKTTRVLVFRINMCRSDRRDVAGTKGLRMASVALLPRWFQVPRKPCDDDDQQSDRHEGAQGQRHRQERDAEDKRCYERRERVAHDAPGVRLRCGAHAGRCANERIAHIGPPPMRN